MKEQIIQLPNNFEVKEIKDGKIILVEKEKKLTYDDVARKLFGGRKDIHYIGEYGDIFKTKAKRIYDLNNCTSSRQAEKLLAINKLMNVAKYLNDGWKPDFNNIKEEKCYICIYCNQIRLSQTTLTKTLTKDGNVYFKSIELAQEALIILGEETIKLALSTDY